MKANDGTGNIPERDLWETPQWLYDILNHQYRFGFDCCAIKGNTKAELFSSDFLNDVPPPEVSWMNPPFSKAKEMFTHFFKVIDRGVAIYRCDNMETRVWQTVILPQCSWVFIPNKRIVYEGLAGNGARFPSALIGLKVKEITELEGYSLIPSMSGTNPEEK